MKTLKNKKGDKFVRVPDKKPTEIAGIKDLLEKGWKFCPKSEWKEKVRDAVKPAKKGRKAPPTKGGKCICGSKKKKSNKKIEKEQSKNERKQKTRA